MEFSEGSSSEILGRLSSAYGVETQKQLAEKLGVSAANVSNWVQRNSVPGSAFVRCALDTGCDLAWLATGRFANAKISMQLPVQQTSSEVGKALIQRMLSTGGRPVMHRVMQAYGFTTQKQLSEYLDISTGTISTWVRRDYFPGDVVIACALDTGQSLEWLATGKGLNSAVDSNKKNTIKIEKFDIRSGDLKEKESFTCDYSLLKEDCCNPVFIEKGNHSWIVDFDKKTSKNGMWLVSVDGVYDIFDLLHLPGKRVKLTTNDHYFECPLDEVELKGKVCVSISNA